MIIVTHGQFPFLSFLQIFYRFSGPVIPQQYNASWQPPAFHPLHRWTSAGQVSEWN
jgi:hypothetical protein